MLEKFTASEVKGEVLLNWVIGAGYTCNGTNIMRSTDSVVFEQIGNISGICGNNSSSVSYTFTDKNPLSNSKNYYRLDFGGLESSDVISLFVILIGDEGYVWIQNPFEYESKIYFTNDQSDLFELSLYDINGKHQFTAQSRDEYIEVIKNNLSNGVYLFRLENKNSSEKISGKILIGAQD